MNPSSISTVVQAPVFAGGGKITFGEKPVPIPGEGHCSYKSKRTHFVAQNEANSIVPPIEL